MRAGQSGPSTCAALSRAACWEWRTERLADSPSNVIDLGAAAQPSQLLRYVLWRRRIRLTPSDPLGFSRHGIHDVHDGFEAELEDCEGRSQFLHIGHVVRF